jgi:hypothetical protein
VGVVFAGELLLLGVGLVTGVAFEAGVGSFVELGLGLAGESFRVGTLGKKRASNTPTRLSRIIPSKTSKKERQGVRLEGNGGICWVGI